MTGYKDFVEAHIPVIPMRLNATEQSEMVSQMLFGEVAALLSVTDKWLEIETADRYTGWIDRKTVKPSLLSFSGAAYKNRPIVKSAFASFTSADSVPLYLSMGSRIPGYQEESYRFEYDNKNYLLEKGEIGEPAWYSAEQCARTAHQLVNTPYLWGGRNFMGIDCSGFTQVVYQVNNVQLPRNASQQVHVGTEVSSLEEARVGDLAFFARAGGNISHVGLLLSQHTIIHASGNVHIDAIDAKGICTGKQEYSHFLAAIRRIKE